MKYGEIQWIMVNTIKRVLFCCGKSFIHGCGGDGKYGPHLILENIGYYSAVVEYNLSMVVVGIVHIEYWKKNIISQWKIIHPWLW